MRSIIESIYPEKERRLFTDREIELALLDRNTQRILDGSGENICFIGLRRVGKSLTLKQYISNLDNDQVFAIYMDFERLDTTPEFFAVQYAGQILRWFMNDENLAPYLDIATLVKKTADFKSKVASDTIYAFFDELNKARPNQRLMLEMAFDFPEKFAREQNINIVLFLDEFQRLKEIDNFPQIREVLGLFRSVLQTQSKTHYVVAGSAIRMLERIFQEADSPLFAQFRVERVSFFEKKASFELASKITGSQNPGVMEMIYKLSSGHPYYIYSICQRMNDIGEINVNGARKAFALETLLRNGSINLMCKYVFESSMSRVRGEALLKTIIRVLAKEDGRKISEISRAIKRKEGSTRNMLERLCDIDLIVKEDKLYYFRDPVLRYWIMNVYEGVEFDALPGKKVLEDMVRDIKEKFEEKKMDIALITGSAGLIGAESVRFFSKKGFNVVGIDNDMRKVFFGDEASTQWSREKLESEIRDYIHYSEDIRDRTAMEAIFKKYNNNIKLIIHTAAQPSHDWAAKDPFTDFTVNANGTLTLLEMTRQYCPDAVFIFTSTNKVYGDTPNDLPLVELETRWEIDGSHPYFKNGIDESMSVDQTKHSLFGASKLAADVLVQEYGRYFNIKTVCFRGGCLTGPGHSSAELHGFLAYLMKCTVTGKHYTIYGYKGKQVRDNIHSFDLVNAFWHFYQEPRIGEVYNMGGGRNSNCSMLEAIAMCEEMTGKKMNYSYTESNRIGDHIWWISDVSKFRSHYPGWEYKYGIKDILIEIFRYGNL